MKLEITTIQNCYKKRFNFGNELVFKEIPVQQIKGAMMFTEKTKHCNFEKTSNNSPEMIKSNKCGILLQLQKSVVVRVSVTGVVL